MVQLLKKSAIYLEDFYFPLQPKNQQVFLKTGEMIDISTDTANTNITKHLVTALPWDSRD